MSAIIDRESAAKVINKAGQNMGEVGESIKNIMSEIYQLSTVVRSQSNSSIYKTMCDFFNELKTINNSLGDQFYDINNGLMSLVNNSGGTSEFRGSLSEGASSASTMINNMTGPKSYDIRTGIADYDDIGNILQSYSNRLSELGDKFSTVVKNYQELYNLAQEGPYNDMMESAHSAACEVRAVANRINNYVTDFSQQFNEHIDYWSAKEGKNNEWNKSVINKLKSIASNSVINLPNAYE